MTPGDNVIAWLIAWASITTGILVSVSGQGTWWLAAATVAQLIAWCAGAPAWACAALTVPLVAALAHAAVYRGRKAARQEMDGTLAMLCQPCHGKPGRCTCPEKCPHPLCGAADTGVTDWSAELAVLLEEGKQQ